MVSIPPTQGLLPLPTGPLQVAPLDRAISPLATVSLSLVIPTFNEGQNLEPLLRQVSGLLDQALSGDYELIVVDDDSPDGTWQTALELTPQFPGLKVMRRQGERGLSSAVIRGWQMAQGRILGVIDADLQHPPEALLALLHHIQSGADLAVGSRHVDGGGVSEWSLVRRFLSRGAQVLGLMLVPGVVGRVSDPMSGYFLVRRAAIAGPLLNPAGYKILLEVLGRGQIDDIAEVGYVFQERTEGESKVTWRQYIDYLHHLVRLRLGKRFEHINQRFPLGRFFRFGIVGLSGVFVDMAILYLLHTSLGLPLTRSKILAGEGAIINNFFWNDAWTFADISQLQQGWGARLKRFLKFNFICLSGLVLNVIVLNIVYNLVFGQRWAYLANLVAIATVTLWNFWLNLKLSWRVTDIQPK